MYKVKHKDLENVKYVLILNSITLQCSIWKPKILQQISGKFRKYQNEFLEVFRRKFPNSQSHNPIYVCNAVTVDT